MLKNSLFKTTSSLKNTLKNSYTTVGYGDMFPVTVPGKIIAAFVMLAGLLIFALPISVLSWNFANVWREYNEEKALKSQEETSAKEAVETALNLADPIQQLKKINIEIWDMDAIGDSDFLGEVGGWFDGETRI